MGRGFAGDLHCRGACEGFDHSLRSASRISSRKPDVAAMRDLFRGALVDLILWRHAEAEDNAPDFGRKLTPRGRKQAKQIAAWLQTRLREPWKVLASPLARAQETALALTAEVETIDAIASAANGRSLLTAAGWPRAEGTIIAVGHQPLLGRACAFLLTGSEADLSVKKSAAWWFRKRGDGAVLVAVMTPDLL